MAGIRLYVGNLSYSTTEQDLREAFGGDGRAVSSVQLMTERDTGRSRGFAFVEMSSAKDADAAVDAMNGYSLGGRNLKVNVAQERTQERSGQQDRGQNRDRGFRDRPSRDRKQADRPNARQEREDRKNNPDRNNFDGDNRAERSYKRTRESDRKQRDF